MNDETVFERRVAGEGFGPDGRRLVFEGHVPGCVHADLLRDGTLKELFWRDNAEKSQWVEKWNWAYEREFDAPEAWEDAIIEFDGLDTYCRVYLNGLEIGAADDMFVPMPSRRRDCAEERIRCGWCFSRP